MKARAKYIHVGFIDLLSDAIYQHGMAAESNDDYIENRCCRASISASVLALECFANALLQSLDISKKLREDLDRLPSISKIETYLQILRAKNNIDHGDNRIQKAKELIQIRNQFVHPKTTKSDSEISEPQDGNTHWIVPMKLEISMYKELKIPRSENHWREGDSAIILEATFQLFDYLYNLIPSMPNKRAIFLNRNQIKSVIMPCIYGEFDAEYAKATKMGLEAGWLNDIINT